VSKVKRQASQWPAEFQIGTTVNYFINTQVSCQQKHASSTTQHDTLCNIDSPASYIPVGIYIFNAINRPCMNSHAQSKCWKFLQCTADPHGTPKGSLRINKKSQRHPISGRQPKDLSIGARATKLVISSNHLLEYF